MKKMQLSIFANIALVLLELIVFNVEYQADGNNIFIYYTNDSNLLALVSGILYLLFGMVAVSRNRTQGIISSWMVKKYTGMIPMAVRLLRFTATSCLMVTFMVVLTVLGPEKGYHHEFLEETRFITHFMGPMISFGSFCFLENEVRLPKYAPKIVLGVTALYAVVLIILNVTGKVYGPYSFLHVLEHPIYVSVFWSIVIIGGAYVIAAMIWKLYNRTKIK